MKIPIYLDYAATTPMEPKIVKKMNNYLTIDGIFGNSASRSHSFGWQAEESIESARKNISNLINAQSREIIFTSGATESNNLAIKGIANFYSNKGNHIITSRIEHKSVIDTCRELEKYNFKITYLKPDKNGIINIQDIKKKIKKKTILISIMHVNNEIGSVQDIENIANLCINNNILFHVDATQSIGKIPVDLKNISIDLMSFSAHKIYGPKGIGALYIRNKSPRIRIASQIHGGGHERGIRSGTLPVHQIVGFGEACKIAQKKQLKDNIKLKKLRNYFWNKLSDIEEIYLNGNLKNLAPHILNISFNYVEGESLIMAIKDIAVASGSACTSASLEPSYVLKALNIKDELAHSSVRFSIGRFTTKKQLKYASKVIHKALVRLRNLSPLWEMFKSGIDINKVNWQQH
ncbi:IscS subfamily cysteine desulfurase [Buchnera aphidicola (Mollitrichosiphum nigrofasciatum)]|uniref:IscS subfamily cysteine desulfurase n=1 Tax=Buchnera aphidicola TaxID=9 RepID=UPI0031B89ECC